ncbi:hypothetical protein J5N97_022127 [Dioscorea zingiberensis]|uniref:Acyl carrier protein n=1 Tax=Dioscorea zingiberensis TaxID=325984 RepID=A0A9D5CBB5_9LILI|nr:hypothetical protein J5N97_022127 [Dioscorea zingiberensis]
MAAVSASFLNFASSLKPTTNLRNGKLSNVKLVSFGMPKTGFFSSKSSRLRICCAAKPETMEKVCEIVKKQLALPEGTTLTPESKFAEDLGADSLDTVELVMTLEEEFGISVEEESSQTITTVQEAADIIEELVQKKGQAV